MALSKLLHVLSAVIWVGGMFFAYMVLRPSIGQLFELPERMRVWDAVFNRFFKWVWLAVCLLLTTGLYMINQYGGMAAMPGFIHMMLLSGIVMMLIFVYLFFSRYKHFKQLVKDEKWPEAGKTLAIIRKLVAVNLLIGLLTISVAMLGRG